jgi:2-keto-3-deoxy-L-rhamnonate aldolase RhmA
VNTAEDALTAVRNCRFPPFGTRSSGSRAIQLDWAELTSHEAARLMNEQTLLVAMIEGGEALENVEAITAVDGIGVLSVGTNDLPMDLGVPPDFLHPTIDAAHKRVVDAARRHGKSVRLGGKYTAADIRIGIERGSRLVTRGSDFNMLLAAMRGMMAEVSTG